MTLFFSKNTEDSSQVAIQVALQVSAIRHYDKYLGLPSFVSRNRTECFTEIKERIWAEMQGWKENLFSQAGKEVMIKVVVQSIPDIKAMIRKFWWGNGETKKIHWVKWSSLCSSKSIGSMRFQDLQKFNNAMLAKQV
ncbi:uncharacterized protein LOC126695834 [Quercus robur]|uniref:uncharacterized protein LOC126695834 n=1 Tax=Quercus robur TaxID=38942 RepID=UPI002162FC5C|nr:uncharacterized protein LOC126695834 [Quercus robur]